ncbi:MAG: GNAT family N-acetyltransferase [Promethearchaeota archaeon]
MEARFYEDLNDFYNIASSFLLKREVENGLLLSLLNALKEDFYRYGQEKPSLCAVFKGNDIKLISLRTPPYNQILSYTDDLETMDTLVEALIKKEFELPGVIGFKKGVDKFVNLWCEKRGVKSKITMNERLYTLQKVAEETIGKNKFIKTTDLYESIVFQWGKEFILEALPETRSEIIEQSLERLKGHINEGRIFMLFVNEKPVSMARKGGNTPNGVAVNLVYTPPSLRRNGYATECVANLSKHLLEEGYKYCFLFTDLSNPTSNSIYQKIGYRSIIDVDEYKFIKKTIN